MAGGIFENVYQAGVTTLGAINPFKGNQAGQLAPTLAAIEEGPKDYSTNRVTRDEKPKLSIILVLAVVGIGILITRRGVK